MQVFPMATETRPKNKISVSSIAVWAITPNGLTLGQDICKKVSRASLFVSETLVRDTKPSPEAILNPGFPKATPLDLECGTIVFKKLSEELAQQFTRFSAHIFIFSTGIAVRMLAPLIQSKTTDPAVIVLDDKAIHAISLLSGHLGGANRLAQEIAALINARPVITTATDINKLPSIDMLARENNLYIENPAAIKHVNMAFLNAETLDIYDPGNYIHPIIPKVFIQNPENPKPGTKIACAKIVCTWKTMEVPRETLVLRPKILSVGIGCNRGTSLGTLHKFFKEVFKGEGLSLNAIFTLATTQIKHDETGLLQLAERLGLPIKFYDKNQLNSVDTIETPSKMVEKHLGVKSVCEAAAILAAGRGPLIVPKKKTRDVTFAVAIKK
jgi:cobalt-precorrin 5A hydrolase